MKIATDNNIRKGEKIIEEIKQVVCDWNKYSVKAKVSSELSSSISKTLIAPEF